MATDSTIVLGLKDSITMAVKNLRIVVKHIKHGAFMEYYDDDNETGFPFREEKVSFNKMKAIKGERNARLVADFYKAYKDYLTFHSLDDDSSSLSVEDLMSFIFEQFDEDDYEQFGIGQYTPATLS